MSNIIVPAIQKSFKISACKNRTENIEICDKNHSFITSIHGISRDIIERIEIINLLTKYDDVLITELADSAIRDMDITIEYRRRKQNEEA